MKRNRQELVNIINRACCCATKTEVLEQSHCIIFEKGKVVCFNGEMASMQNYDIGFEASVPVQDLLNVLNRFPDEEVVLLCEGSELKIKGKNKRAGIAICSQIRLPYKEIPISIKPKSIEGELYTQLLQASRVCGKDFTEPKTTHVHVSKNTILATDSYRLFYSEIETGLPEMYIPAYTLLNIGNADIIRISSKDNWLHLFTKDKVQYIIRCSSMDYFKPEIIQKVLNIEGTKTTLPATLQEALQRAEVMQGKVIGESGEKEVNITLKDNKLYIRTQKEGGWYEEKTGVKYTGTPIRFIVNPQFLNEILQRTNNVIISSTKMKLIEKNIQVVVRLEEV